MFFRPAQTVFCRLTNPGLNPLLQLRGWLSLLILCSLSLSCRLDDNRLRGNIKFLPGQEESAPPPLPDELPPPPEEPPPPSPLVLVVDTSLGVGTMITLPLRGDVDVTIDWGDDNANDSCPRESTSPGDISCDYMAEAEYQIEILGSLSQFGNGSGGYPNANKILRLESWGELGLTSLSGAFRGASALTTVANPPSGITDMSHMFYAAATFNQPIGGWDTSVVTDMSWMFYSAEDFDQPIGDWNTESVTTMFRMFAYASSFNQAIGDWNTSSVTNMSRLFDSANLFNQPIGNWDTSKVTTLRQTFQAASSFNQDISSWDTAKVTTFVSMFWGAHQFNQDLSDWNTSKVSDMWGMFFNAISFNRDISCWDVSKISSDPVNFNGPILSPENKPRWGTTGCSLALEVDTNLGLGTEVTLPLYGTVDLQVDWGDDEANQSCQTLVTTAGQLSCSYAAEGEYTIKLRGTLTQFGNGSSSYSNANKIVRLINWGGLGLTSLSGAFRGTGNLEEVAEPPGTVTDLSHMFRSSSFNGEIGHWNTSNVTDMSFMFSQATFFDRPIGGWNTGNVTSFRDMFSLALSFDQPLDSWDTSNANNMRSMFEMAGNFNQPINSWVVDSVLDMSYMFRGAESFDRPLNNWNTSSVLNMTWMFRGATFFNQDLSCWDVEHLSPPTNFATGSALTGPNTPKWEMPPGC